VTSPAERSLAAEVRAIEEGHRSYLQPDGSYRVVSDSRPGKWYRVDVALRRPGSAVGFSCRPEGPGSYRDDHLAAAAAGLPPCKHAALVARRLEREGLASWAAGEWAVAGEPTGPVEDPFACFR
jgi:hypothetical protein